MKNTHKYASICALILQAAFTQAQLSGSYNIPGNFSSLGVAINSLNTYGVAGSVTINIAAGYTELVGSGGYTLYPVVGSSSLNTVTFRKSGVGTNPILYSYNGLNTSTSFTQDGVWRFVGADYITVDRINITDLNVSSPGTMEFGFGFFKASTNDGCQHNTISNCVITLRKGNNANGSGSAVGGSRGIDLVNAFTNAHTSNIGIVSPDGSHSYNRFYGNLIQDCNFGISMNSILSATAAAFSDSFNDVGGTNAVTGNTIINYGGGGTLSAAGGIYTKGQQDLNISNNFISNAFSGGGVPHRAQNLYGIFTDMANGANVTVGNNTVSVRSGSACPAMYAILNDAGSAGVGNTVSITGNLISNATFSASNAHFYGIYNTSTAEHLYMTGNTFSNNVNNQSSSGVTFLIRNSAKVKSTVNISDNVATYSLSVFGGYTGVLQAISSTDGTPNTAVTFSNNTFPNFYLAASSIPYYIYVDGVNRNLTIQNNSWNNLSQYLFSSVVMINNSSATHSQVIVSGNSITNFTNSVQGTGFTGYGGYNDSPSTCSMVIASNTLANIQYTYTSGNATLMGILVNDGIGPTYPHKQIYNNLITGINSNRPGSVTGMLVGFLGEGNGTQPSSVHHNTIMNISGKGNITGLQTYSLVAPNYFPEIHSNIIHSVVCTGTSQAIGVKFDNGITRLKFYRNRITHVTNLGSVLQAWGIEAIIGDSVYVYNNIIGNITAQSSGSQDAALGMFITGGKFFGVYYNTFYLEGGAHGSACLHAYSNPNVDTRNNLFVNLAAAAGNGTTAAYRRTSGALATYDIKSNNNLFYAGTPGPYKVLVQQGVPSYSTLALVKTYLGGREMNSVTENPPFASVTHSAGNYLHINSGTPTQIESGAMPITWITEDYYGNPRNPNFPDIGAIEGTYTPASGDNLKPSVKSHGFTSALCGQSGRTFTAQIADKSGVATGSLSPRLYYRVNNGTYTSVPGTLSSGTAVSGLWSFSLSYTVTYGDVIHWFLAAQDVSATPNVLTYPPVAFPGAGSSVNSITTTPGVANTYTVYMPLGGTYSVGAGGTFSTLNAAAAAYKNACLTGPVTFVLSDALYSASTETFPIVFERNLEASGTRSLLIVPAPGLQVTVKGHSTTASSAVLKLLDARHVTVDGLNSGGSSLTIYNTKVSSPSGNIWLASSNTWGGGNRQIQLRNLYLTADDRQYPTGIMASRNSIGFSNNDGADNDSISITGNTITAAQYGIMALGSSSLSQGGCDNWLISNNQVGPAVSSTANISSVGIWLKRTVHSSIQSNTVSNVTYTGGVVHGIYLMDGVNNFTVASNTIRDVKTLPATYGLATGLILDPLNSQSNIYVVNNMISAVVGASTNITFAPAGIRVGHLYPAGGIRFYNNTVAMTHGSLTSNGSALWCSALYLGNDAEGGLELRNNIFYSNVHNNFNSGSRTYGVFSTVSASVFSVMDHNNYYTPGPQGVMGFIAGSTRTTIAAMQAGFGQNVNSKSIQPVFTSTNDVHIDPAAAGNTLMEDLGTPLTEVPADIDGQTRSLSTPDMGADEFAVTATCTAASGGTLSPVTYTVCSTASLNLQPDGVSGGLGAVYAWQAAPTATGTFSNITAGSGFSSPAYNTSGLLPGGVYYVKLNTSCPSASLTGASNIVTLVVVAAPTINVVQSHTTVCAGTSATLSASGANTFSWSTGVISPSIVITPTASGLYRIYYGSSPCTFSTSQNISVFYSQNPVVTAAASANSVCAGYPVTLTATGASTYSWLPAGATGTTVVTPSVQTTYTVSGYLANGCSAKAFKTVSVAPGPALSVSGPSLLCTSQQITLTATGAGSYTWSTGASTPSIVVTPTSTTAYTVAGTAANSCTAALVHTVSVTGAQPVSITAPSSVCAGQSATVVATGAGTYTWNTGQNTATIVLTPSITGTYSVTGATGSCFSSATVNIMVNPVPLVSVSGNTAICSGQSSTLSASGAASYSWTTGALQSSIVVSPSVSTAYSVTGTSSAGCPAQATFTVVSNSSPVINISASSATVCAASPVTLSASGAASYTWSGGPSGAVIIVSPSVNTVYTVSGSSAAGCAASKTIAIGTGSLPVISITPASATVCPFSPASFTASGATSYTWSNGGGTNASATFSQASAAIYTVTGAGANGCRNTRTLTVSTYSIPLVSVAGNSAICTGQSANLVASGAAGYSWSTGAGTASISVSPSVNTSYTVLGTSASGCTAQAVFAVISNSTPVISIAASAGSVCAMAPASFTASGAGSYTWNTGATGGILNVTPSVSLVYTVTGSSVAGCLSSKTVAISTGSVPVITVSPSAAAVCSQSPLSFTASGANTYTWSTGPGGAFITFTPAASGLYTVAGTSSVTGCVGNKTFSVTVYPQPVIAISGATAVCGGQTATLTAAGASSYTWNTGSTAGAIIVSPATNTVFAVSGTSSAGCIGNASFAVVSNSLPVLGIALSATAVCATSPVTLTASGAGTYSWSHGAAGSVVVVSPSLNTVYTVSGASSAGCQSTATVAVTAYSLPALSVSPPSASVCAFAATSFTASGAGSYSWTNGGTGSVSGFTPATSTVYTVIGVDAFNSCVRTQSFAVTVYSLPVIAVSGSTAVCAGQPNILMATGAGTYSWNTGATTSSISVSPLVNSIYIVTGTNALGCSSGATFAVTSHSLPVINITQTAPVVCALSPVSFTASGALSYTWSTGASGSVITVNPPGNSVYTVSGFSGAGCGSNATVSIGTYSLPVLLVQPQSATVCAHTPVSFTVTGAGSYTWSHGATGAMVSVTPVASAVYTVTGVHPGNGCVNSKTVSVTANPMPVIAIAGPTALCMGQPGILTASGASGYTWSTGATTQSIAILLLADSNFVVTGISLQGCPAAASIAVVTHSLPLITISPASATICEGEAISFYASGGASYTWHPGNTSGPLLNIIPADSSIWLVLGIDANGCPNTATAQVFTGPCTGLVTHEAEALSILPNPFWQRFYIRNIDPAGDTRLRIYGGTGKLLLDRQLLQQEEEVNLERYANGVYYVHIVSAGRTVLVKKLIRQD